ncbi:MAG: glycosyltransferase family 2 protein [Clostridia bacterium]|nr:glycosyltransferase family 2 protein [Clostridia bacterium]
MFSVILPVYNGEHYIANAVNSVLAQSFMDWELIVVNDGSKDHTLDILNRYQADTRIHIINQENGGVSVARNNAMKAAKGDYFAFLDADDLWYDNHLQTMHELITEYPDAGLYATFAQVNLQNGKVVKSCNYFKNNPGTVYLEDFYDEYIKDKSVKVFVPTSTCISRAAYDKVQGYPVGCKIGEDLEHDLRVAAYFPVVITDRITSVYEKRYSTATKDVSFDPDWGFFDKVNELYEDETIPASKRENIKTIMQWFAMRRCRHYIIDGDKKKAREVFKNMDKKAVKLSDIMINAVLLTMPVSLVRRIFAVRWRGKA